MFQENWHYCSNSMTRVLHELNSSSTKNEKKIHIETDRHTVTATAMKK